MCFCFVYSGTYIHSFVVKRNGSNALKSGRWRCCSARVSKETGFISEEEEREHPAVPMLFVLRRKDTVLCIICIEAEE